jgi:hypothetical protein
VKAKRTIYEAYQREFWNFMVDIILITHKLQSINCSSDRLERFLTMVYAVQNYRAYLFPALST